MNTYCSYVIYSIDEALLGLLTQFEFESFEENEDNITGYIQESFLTPEIKNEISEVIEKFTINYNIETILPQNWNAIWEESFQPVLVDNFCQIRADFHPVIETIKYDIIINPKMAFGTGHHGTTFMMIKHMESMDFKDKKVLDFGCGTGILAILASKLGANPIFAIDIEKESFLNTLENSEINNTFNIEARQGGFDDIPHVKYDIVLANINRNILLKYGTSLKEKLNHKGYIIISGVLIEDELSVINSFKNIGFELINSIEKEGWMSAKLRLEE